MKRQRSIHPGVETLEHKALLSTVVAPHIAAELKAAPIVVETARAGVALIGAVVNGYGGVSPLGGVRGYLNIQQRTLILANSRGSLALALSHVHKYPHVVNAFEWTIKKGSGEFASLQGQGRCTVTAVFVRGRITTWSAAFYV